MGHCGATATAWRENFHKQCAVCLTTHTRVLGRSAADAADILRPHRRTHTTTTTTAAATTIACTQSNVDSTETGQPRRYCSARRACSISDGTCAPSAT